MHRSLKAADGPQSWVLERCQLKQCFTVVENRMKKILVFSTLLFTAAAAQAHNSSQALPTQVGKCAITTVKSVEQRLEDGSGHSIPDSGSAIQFTNGGYQVSYEQVPAVNKSKVGDKVVMCLVELPTDCPAGDERGKVYTTTNLRTLEFFTLADAEHMCGGA